MEKVKVALSSNSYDIFIGSGLMSDYELIGRHIEKKSVFIISNKSVATHYLDRLVSSLPGFDFSVYLMPEGEQFKNLRTIEEIIGVMLKKGANRTTTILALGGGVVGDTAGFVAAIFQRGVPFLQIPTTLLAQVDSSVGGKTAVNHEDGKNMIGAFYQPKTVIVDTDTLNTLPEREISTGLAEIIKHGILADSSYFDWIEKNISKLRRLDSETLKYVVAGSCRIKAGIVSEDELEIGKRALLNLGHTFGHAIETATGYSDWRHGEAVGAGLVMAADLSFRLGMCALDDAKRIKALVTESGLPCAPPSSMEEGTFLRLMSRDKKVDETGLRFVLVRGGIGDAALVERVPLEKLRETLRAGENLCSRA